MSELFYRPGLVFFSKNAGYQQIISRDHKYNVYPDGSREVAKSILVADFADNQASGSQMGDRIDGQQIVYHNSAGGVFDLDEAANRLGWDEDDKEQVARVMLKLHENPAFQDFELAPGPKPATLPWPTYDTTHFTKVASLAGELGLVAEALAYERENKARESVLKALEEKIPVEADEESLAAV